MEDVDCLQQRAWKTMKESDKSIKKLGMFCEYKNANIEIVTCHSHVAIVRRSADVCEILANSVPTLIIADGKGKIASPEIADLYAEIKDHYATGKHSPSDILTLANSMLQKTHPKDSVFFASAACFSINPDGNIDYAVAGHPPAFLYRASDKSVEQLNGGDEKNPLLGVIENVTYDAYNTELHPNDVLLAYTDGLTEERNPVGEFYGDERLEVFLKKYGSLAPIDIAKKLYTSLKDFRQHTKRLDEFSYAIIKISAEILKPNLS